MRPEQFCGWCGKGLVGKRPHAEYCDSSCRGEATRWRQSRPGDDAKALGSAATPPIAIIRAEQEAAKGRWSMIVREGIIDRLRRNPTEPFHADDLERLGIPDEHRNVIGSQIAKLVNQRWIVECGRRKSVIPSRNGAKSNEYRLTELGTRSIAGLGAGTPRVLPPTDGPREPRSHGEAARSSAASAESGESESVAEELKGTEAHLFEEPVPIAASSPYSPDNEFA